MSKTCESCGRNHYKLGEYCENCVDKDGNLKSFEEVRESLAKHISETQGYAEVAALKVADSILESRPAWSARFLKSDKQSGNRKPFFPLASSFFVGAIVALLVVAIVSGLFTSGTKKSSYVEKMVVESAYGYIHQNSNFYIYEDSVGDLSGVYIKNKKTGEISQIGEPWDFQAWGNMRQSWITDDYVAWTVENKIFASDFDGNFVIVTDQVDRFINDWDIKILDNCLVYGVALNNMDMEFYAHNLSRPDSESMRIMKVVYDKPNYYKDNDTWKLEKSPDGKVLLFAVQQKEISDEGIYSFTYRFDLRQFYGETVELNPLLFADDTAILDVFDKTIVYQREINDFSDITDSNLVRLITPTRFELLLYDKKTQDSKSIGVFDNLRYEWGDGEKVVFFTEDPGEQVIYLKDKPGEQITIKNTSKKNSSFYCYYFEEGELEMFFEDIAPPRRNEYMNKTLGVAFNSSQFVFVPHYESGDEDIPLYRYDFITRKLEELKKYTSFDLQSNGHIRLHEEEIYEQRINEKNAYKWDLHKLVKAGGQ